MTVSQTGWVETYFFSVLLKMDHHQAAKDDFVVYAVSSPWIEVPEAGLRTHFRTSPGLTMEFDKDTLW